VALNTDASTRRLGKGDDRPLNNEMDRAIGMASQEAVSLVTWFGEDNPQALIAEIRPDILVKGGDHHMEVLPETALMQTWGGTALAGYSTSALERRIRAQGTLGLELKAICEPGLRPARPIRVILPNRLEFLNVAFRPKAEFESYKFTALELTLTTDCYR